MHLITKGQPGFDISRTRMPFNLCFPTEVPFNIIPTCEDNKTSISIVDSYGYDADA